MTHHAKAPSAGSIQATGNSRGLFRRAFVTRGASRGSKGSGAPSSRRVSVALFAALAITVLAMTATPALAAPPSVTTPEISDVSYASVHVTGKLSSTSDPVEFFGATIYGIQYSTDNKNWTTAFSAYLGEAPFSNRPIGETINLSKGGTKYFVRFVANNGAFFGADTEVFSPEPNPSFTTLPVDPPSVLTIDNASEVAYTTATVKGEVNRPANADPAFDIDCHFEYVTDEQFDANPPGEEFTGATPVPCEPENPVHATGPSKVEAHLTGLANDTEYHLRLVAANASPTTDAKVAAQAFTTLKVDPPSVTSLENASDVEFTQAEVKGVVERPNTSDDPAFDITSCNFEYVTDQQFNDNPTGEEFAGATPVACEGVSPESPIHATGQTPVKAHLGSLAPSTTFHLRLSASNLGGSDAKEAAATFTTAGPIPKPIVLATDNASEISPYSAEFTGKVQRPAGDDPGLNTNCHFEYISDAQFTANEGNGDPGFTGAQPADCVENPIEGTGETTVSAKAGLSPNSTYHFRLVAENAGGSDAKDAPSTFTTPEAEKPTVTIDPVAGGTFTTAHVSGVVDIDDPGHPSVAVWIEASADGGVSWENIPITNAITGSSATIGPHVVERNFTGLQPSTTYTFRIAASYNYVNRLEDVDISEVAFSPEPNPSITTGELFAPTAEDLAVTNVTANTAHFSATVNPNAPAGPLSEPGKKAFATHWEFVCVPECKNANGNPIEGTVQGEEGAQPVAGDAKGLDPDTEYEVSLVVSSEGGEDTETVTFPTPLIKPTIKAAPGGSDGKGGYTLQATVNPNGSNVTDCKFEWGPNSADYAFTADCSPTPGDKAQPVTVEAHLTGLNPGVVYHFNLLATNAAGTAESGDQEFIPTLDPPKTCPNEQVRKENNSLALPECRAYERVTPEGKEGFDARLDALGDGDRIHYRSDAGNIARSGSGYPPSHYVSGRSAGGWETIPNLNGSSGSLRDAPSFVDTPLTDFVTYSSDLLSSIWSTHRQGDPAGKNFYLRGPGGAFTLIGSEAKNVQEVPKAASADLSHLVVWPRTLDGGNAAPTQWGPGVYEFVGTGVDVPRRVDVDNSDSPVSSCIRFYLERVHGSATARAISTDGRVIVFTSYGPAGTQPGTCGIDSPPADEIWARVNGATSFNVSASQCNRIAPAEPCNATARASFAAATPDGSRIFFTTTQQLLNGDTDQTNDIYACDIPTGNPAPIGAANSCASLIEVSGSSTDAEVEPPVYASHGPLVANPGVQNVSDDGSTVLFVAKGALTDNEDALGEQALAGDHNLYAWRTDAAHPSGQTSFVGRLDSNDLVSGGESPQSTPDGRYLVFTTASQLVETDTDNTRDVYRYDVEAEELTRASTNVFGVAGNGASFPAQISDDTVSDDGQKIVFTTTEKLSEDDGNGEPDLYLWTPARVSLISTGAVGGGATFVRPGTAGGLQIQTGNFAINGSGRDIYFETPGALTPADGDAVGDVYDARIGGGFSFAPKPTCTGEDCQPLPPTSPPTPASPTNRPNGEGNVKPKTCPKGKVAKGNKCVKKKHKKHSGKKHHGKKAAPKRGGGK